MRPFAFFPRPVSSAVLTLLALLTGCAVGPDYQPPSAPEQASFSSTQPLVMPANGWALAAPADALTRGPWWELFGDPVLNQLAVQVQVSNQNVAAAVAAYAQARALVREQRAALFPAVTLSSGATRSGSGGSTIVNSNGTVSNGGRVGNNFQASIGASWEPDVWGRLGRSLDAAGASASASAADLATATLSAQGELVLNYLSLRQNDVQQALLAQTIAGFERALQVTQNRYGAAIVPKTDVLQAQTQLANSRADAAGLTRQREQFEHALAVLLGQAPGNFRLAPLVLPAMSSAMSPSAAPTISSAASATALLAMSSATSPLGSAALSQVLVVPEIPVGLPSSLLQRRPDIAAAERRVALANQQIGIATSAYYPSFTLNASTGSGASRLADLFSAPSSLWSLGLSAAQSVFNAGATSARVEAAQAAQAEAVARYRQTVLTAFQAVEDQLSATRVLAQQLLLRRQAAAAADQVEQQVFNRYTSGLVVYTEVITAQITALSARRALSQAMGDQQTTALALIQALGGGWAGLSADSSAGSLAESAPVSKPVSASQTAP